MPRVALGQGDEGGAGVEPAQIPEEAVARMLRRLGYYGELGAAFMRWAEVSVPIALRPITFQTVTGTAYVDPPAVVDLLIGQSGAVESPWPRLIWGAVGTAIGAVIYAIVRRYVAATRVKVTRTVVPRRS